MKILLVFPPIATPVSHYLSTPLLAGQLKDKGFDVECLDLSIEFFNCILKRNFLESQYSKGKLLFQELSELLANKAKGDKDFKSYSFDVKKNILKRQMLENILKNEDENIKIINNIEEYVNSYKNPDIFYDSDKMNYVANEIYKALNIAMMPYFPAVLNFNSYKFPFIK